MFYLKLWNYIYYPSRCQRKAIGGPLEATGGNEGQFPRTDFGRCPKSSPPPKPPGPPKLRLFGESEILNENLRYNSMFSDCFS